MKLVGVKLMAKYVSHIHIDIYIYVYFLCVCVCAFVSRIERLDVDERKNAGGENKLVVA